MPILIIYLFSSLAFGPILLGTDPPFCLPFIVLVIWFDKHSICTRTYNMYIVCLDIVLHEMSYIYLYAHLSICMRQDNFLLNMQICT